MVSLLGSRNGQTLERNTKMIRIAIGIVIGVALMTTFPEQTQNLSDFARGQINQGAQVIVEQTDQSVVDKFRY